MSEQRSDLIKAVDQTPVTGARSLGAALAKKKPNRTVTLAVARGDKQLQLPVKLSG